MKVILRADVERVGNKGDILDVADGFARNYLVPKGLALKASRGAVAQAAAMRRAREARDARDREAAQEIAQRLEQVTVRVPARAGAEGRLFGSVTATDIAKAVEAQTGVELDRRRIELDDIRSLGTHEAVTRLHPEVEVHLQVEVVDEGQ